MKNFNQILLAVGLFALAGSASAMQITGSIGFTGAYTHVALTFLMLQQFTSLTLK